MPLVSIRAEPRTQAWLPEHLAFSLTLDIQPVLSPGQYVEMAWYNPYLVPSVADRVIWSWDSHEAGCAEGYCRVVCLPGLGYCSLG